VLGKTDKVRLALGAGQDRVSEACALSQAKLLAQAFPMKKEPMRTANTKQVIRMKALSCS
jgi:hypothetical protein